VEEACTLFFGKDKMVFGIKVSSGQYAQPVGLEETYAGALTRATTVRRTDKTAIAIGIESGIIFLDNDTVVDIAVIVVIDQNGSIITSTSTGVMVPSHCVKVTQEQGFKTTTVGSIIAEFRGCDPADPHSSLTGGIFSRKQALVTALTAALSQL
jgi:non-canonical (house-cleaning) NTP pyrophosphatase